MVRDTLHRVGRAQSAGTRAYRYMHTLFLQQNMYAIADGPRFSHSGTAVVGSAAHDGIGLYAVSNTAVRLAQAVRRLRT